MEEPRALTRLREMHSRGELEPNPLKLTFDARCEVCLHEWGGDVVPPLTGGKLTCPPCLRCGHLMTLTGNVPTFTLPTAESLTVHCEMSDGG